MNVLRIESVRVDENGGRWLRPRQLQEQFSMSRGTLWKLLKKMKEVPRYKNSVLFLSKTMKLVSERDFLEFLQSRDMAYWKE